MRALALVCSLNASPTPSSSHHLADQVMAELASHGVTGETVRVDGEPGGGASALPGANKMPPPSARPIGSTSTVNGKTAVWDGQKWVPRA